MNKIKNLLISLFLLVPGLAFAQTSTTQTSLSVAVADSKTTTITVASATGINAPSANDSTKATLLFIDTEAMFVTNVSGTTVKVQRGASGTLAAPHNSGAVVWVGSPNSPAGIPGPFVAVDPTGSCTVGNTFSPMIDVTNGVYWNCVNSTWYPLLSTGTITPVATAASIGTTAQTFTVKGLASGEPIVVFSQPAPTSLCPLVTASVTAANTVSLYWSTLTAAACTPASGTYLISASRFAIGSRR